MKFKNVLIVVKDIKKSTNFYKELFGMEVLINNGGNVILTGGLVLQDHSIWCDFMSTPVLSNNNASELYFEEANIERFAETLDSYHEPIRYVHRLTKHSWGASVIRFYDPDGNLIEVGTP